MLASVFENSGRPFQLTDLFEALSGAKNETNQLGPLRRRDETALDAAGFRDLELEVLGGSTELASLLEGLGGFGVASGLGVDLSRARKIAGLRERLGRIETRAELDLDLRGAGKLLELFEQGRGPLLLFGEEEPLGGIVFPT